MRLTKEENDLRKQALALYANTNKISQFDKPDEYRQAKEEYAAFFKALPNNVKYCYSFRIPFNSPRGRKMLKDLPFFTS